MEEIVFLSQLQSQVATLPAINQSFSFGDQNNKYMEFWATAYYQENKYLTLSYVGPNEDKTLRAIFEHILASSQTTYCAQQGQVANDYAWRQAHILHLQIPHYLQPPRHYTYVSPEGSLKLKVSLYNYGDIWPNNSAVNAATKDLRFEGSQGIFSMQYHNNLKLQWISYVFQGGVL